MSLYDIENFPYPMFKTNIWEKFLLRRSIYVDSTFLCVRLADMSFSKGLIKKIELYLRDDDGDNTLDSYLWGKGADLNNCNKREMRTIWANKLISYKGE